MQKQVQVKVGIVAVLMVLAAGAIWLIGARSSNEDVAPPASSETADTKAAGASVTTAGRNPKMASAGQPRLGLSRPELPSVTPRFVAGGSMGPQRARAKREFEELVAELELTEDQQREFLVAVLDFQMQRQAPLKAAMSDDLDSSWDAVQEDSFRELKERLDVILTPEQQRRMRGTKVTALALRMAIVRTLAVE